MKKKYLYIISFLFFRISWVAYAKETGIGYAIDIGKILAEIFLSTSLKLKFII